MKTKKQFGTKWFKFLIYFTLWLNAIVCGIEGFAALAISTGIIDTVYGVAMLAFAIFCIITRSRLAKFKKGAPSLLYALYILGIVLSLFYLFGSVIASGNDISLAIEYLLTPDYIGSIAGSIIAVVINKVYFGKRKHLFVN